MFDNLKQEIYKNINESKKIVKEIETKKNNLSKNIPLLEQFISIGTENSDKLRKFYIDKNITKILLSESRNYSDYLIETKSKEEIANFFDKLETINSVDDSIIEIADEILNFIKNKINKLTNTDDFRNLRTLSKNILEIIENRYYKKDQDSINKVIEYMKLETDLLDDEIEKISFYMLDEYKKEKKKELEKQMKLQLEKLEKENIVIEDETKEELEIKEKIQKKNILTDDERNIINEINSIILSKNDELKYLNDEFIEQIKKDDEMYEEYKSDILLYDLNRLIKKIFNIQAHVNNKLDLTDIQLNKYMFLKHKIMSKTNNIYLEYNKLNHNEVEEKIEDINTKTLIYLTNENSNLYFDIDDFDREQIPSINIIINELEQGILHTDYIKDCVYTDDKLKGTFRKRNADIRALYLPYKDYVFVITMFFKNTNQTKKIREYMNNVVSKTKKQIKQLKEDLNDEVKREEIIYRNNLITNDIKSKLKSKVKQKAIKE